MNRRRTKAVALAGILAVVAAGGVAWWLLRGEPTEPEVEPDATASNARPARDRRAGREYRPGRAPDMVSATAVRDSSAGSGIVEGQVLSWATNEPIGDAELTFARGESVSSTMSDMEGGFLFRAGQPGTYELATVTAEGYLPYAPEWGHSPIRLQARPEHRIRGIIIHLRPAVEYLGKVVNPEGAAVAGAEVIVLSARQGQSALAPLPERFSSDDRGEFRFQAPFGALIEARHKEYSPGRTRINGRAHLEKRVTVKLRPSGRGAGSDEAIGGQVVDSGGRPVEGALVRAGLARRGLRRSAQALSDEEGRFLVEGLDPGRYFVVATADGMAPARAPGIPTGRDDIRLELRDGISLRGVVTDAQTSEPVPGFSVVVEARFGNLRRATYRTEAFFDAQGRYEVAGLEPRPYSVFVSSQGYASSEPQDILIGSSDSADVTANFRLTRGGQASGVVVDSESGQPVADAQVSLEAPPSRSANPVPVTARTVTDWNGRFEIRGLTPGRRSLVVTADDYHRRIISGLEVSDDGSLPPLNVELSPMADGEDPAVELTGIGAILSARRDELLIVRLIEGGGAAEVGLSRGDAILWVDGQRVTELGFVGAIERIRGPEGTAVRLVVRRMATAEVVELTVPRRRVRSS